MDKREQIKLFMSVLLVHQTQRRRCRQAAKQMERSTDSVMIVVVQPWLSAQTLKLCYANPKSSWAKNHLSLALPELGVFVIRGSQKEIDREV